MLESSNFTIFSSRDPSAVHRLHFLQFHLFSSSAVSAARILKSRSGNVKENSYAADYLINFFGFSRKRALRVCEKIKFGGPEIPASVIAFFKKHGFSEFQIARIVGRSPAVFQLNPKRNLLPKIQFFYSLGISGPDTAKIISTSRFLLGRSLKNQLIPSFELIKSFVKSNEDAVNIIKRCPSIIELNVQSTMTSNVASLLNAGIPEAKIVHAFKKNPRVLVMSPDKLSKCVEKIKQMGFDPCTGSFLTGLYVMRKPTSSVWNRKMEVYKKWGYSESQVLASFRKFPWCMGASADKINRAMDYFINQLCDPLVFLRVPQIVSLSFEETIVPRCSVLQFLKSRGLLRKNASLSHVLIISKKKFFEQFVLGFADETPELLELYPQRLHPSK
ncbi:hypothetical protein F511_02231 [Dorcoceras hygrometricum]|uniref:Mitochondrial transcription termination factor family protein n=1 Tax=Dorcoceras hygrometricum TaxID=472368 RepID=A0A2Z7AR32_9LAMI|nr:hypothetical protein F511_02231 [Dorcoceras hygrometricum]